MVRTAFFPLLLLLSLSGSLAAQNKPLRSVPATPAPLPPATLGIPKPIVSVPSAGSALSSLATFLAKGPLPAPARSQAPQKWWREYRDPQSGRPIWITGTLPEAEGGSFEEKTTRYFQALAEPLGIEAPAEELTPGRFQESGAGRAHWRFTQEYQGIPVYGSELILHFDHGVPRQLNGRCFPTPRLEGAALEPAFAEMTAVELAKGYLLAVQQTPFLPSVPEHLLPASREQARLVIFHPAADPDRERLAWEVILLPNLVDRWQLLLDALTGEVLQAHNESCRFHGAAAAPAAGYVAALPPPGPAIANATDLLGVSRTINTYESGGNYFLIDATRTEMFVPQQSVFPNDPVGVIWTVDAFNGSWQSADFSIGHVVSPNNAWNNPTAVSAHYNAGEAYEYFLSTFDRVSINGQGGNIVSLINVADDNGPMDNAFWNGFAMFYGNGNVAFQPLARGKDVAGHEMSHGVIQSTANLEYFGESGALNESFADIFGAMIDRDDWRIGEDVVKLSAFPSGALRDLSNPNQGGNGINDPGWQPDHVNEQYTGSLDNGGVHINSGIPNHAYYLVAQSIGKDEAEQIFYKALDEYLVKSSQFIDCRLAAVQAATDLHGTNSSQVNAVKSAFDAVGIVDGQGGNYQEDFGTNPGDEYLVTTDPNQSALYLYEGGGSPVVEPLSQLDPVNRPSVTDDGSAMVFVAADKTIRVIFFDWAGGTYTEDVLQSDPIWYNVAVSRDGLRLAALTDDPEPLVWVFDYGLGEWRSFELYNPTYTQGVETGDALYADVLEWDFSGQYVLYDAYNVIESTFGADIDYWDIGFLHVWNAYDGYWAGGNVAKLFSALPENTSVGNPTFAKNSDYIIAFDWIDNYSSSYELYGVNLQTGATGVIFDNPVLNYPNYSIDDERIAFNALDLSNNDVLGYIELNPDKISPAGNGVVLLDNRSQGVFFANGLRPLADEEVALPENALRAFPNPTGGVLTIELELDADATLPVEVVDLLGRSLQRQWWNAGPGRTQLELSLAQYPAGQYVVRVGRQSIRVYHP